MAVSCSELICFWTVCRFRHFVFFKNYSRPRGPETVALNTLAKNRNVHELVQTTGSPSGTQSVTKRVCFLLRGTLSLCSREEDDGGSTDDDAKPRPKALILIRR